MPLTVVLGRTGHPWEDLLIAQAGDAGERADVIVVQCRSLVDLLVTAETTPAALVVVGEDFPRLVDGLSRLRSVSPVLVVGTSAMADVRSEQLSLARAFGAAGQADSSGAGGDGNGRTVAVWGPPGSWGSTTVAIGLARRAGGRALLIDANVHAASVGQLLDLPGGGLLQACLSADRGRLHLPVQPASGMDVLTGVEPSLYPAVHAGALQEVIRAARGDYEHVVLDLDSALDAGAEIGIVPDWTTATAVGLREADHAVIVTGESDVALQRLWQALPAVAGCLSGRATVVINRCADPRRTTAELAERLGDFLPEAAVGWISTEVTDRSLTPIVEEVCG